MFLQVDGGQETPRDLGHHRIENICRQMCIPTVLSIGGKSDFSRNCETYR